jgi:hypothetical protein
MVREWWQGLEAAGRPGAGGHAPGADSSSTIERRRR